MIDLKQVHKAYGDFQVLKSAGLKLEKGEVVAIIGPSGSGKSTLLKTINQLVDADSGTLAFDGKKYDLASVRKRDVHAIRRQIGMVFQNFGLFKHLTVERNITLGLEKVHGLTREAASAIAYEVLEQVGLSDKRSAYPNTLSGGQQQRVGIARAIAPSPKLLLLDEPTSALDPELVSEVLKVIKRLSQAGNTMIIVTHEMQFARQIADRIVFMDAGEIVADAAPEVLFSTDAPPRIKRFLAHLSDAV